MKKKIVVSLIIYMLFAASPARAETAIDFYRLGLESSMFNKKIHYFTKAVELNPTLAVAYEKRGRLYYFQEKYGEMLRDFRRFTALKPSDPEGYRMIGLAQLKLGNLAEAIIKLSRAIEMDPFARECIPESRRSLLPEWLYGAGYRRLHQGHSTWQGTVHHRQGLYNQVKSLQTTGSRRSG
jgi:tetratricopeptide (TPR) repeat protein